MPTIRLAVLGQSPCFACAAACCKQNGHDYAVLLQDLERRKFTPFAQPVTINNHLAPVVVLVLPYRNARCVFLGQDDRCTIYEDRPLNCQRFQCVPGFRIDGPDGPQHSEFLKMNPQVLDMLQRL